MKKLLIILLCVLAMSCADSKTFNIDGKDVEVQPYGWANKDARKIDGVVYEVNAGNIFWDIILVETIFVPIWLTGWQAMEPIRYDSKK